MLMAVSRVCFRDGTKTRTGFLGECFITAWYTGLAMDSSRVCVWLMLKPCQKSQTLMNPKGFPAKLVGNTGKFA